MARDKTVSPLVRKTRELYIDWGIMLAGSVLLSWYFHGENALWVIVWCLLTALVCELVVNALSKKNKLPFDYNSLFTGLAIAMMLPANASYAMCIAGVLFAILAVKVPFGGTHSAPFVPAAAGFAFVCVCFGAQVFAYPPLHETMDGSAFAQGTSVAWALQNGMSLQRDLLSIINMICGSVSGPLGTGGILAMLVSCVWMLFRRPKMLLSTAGFLASCIAMSAAFPRAFVNGPVGLSIVFELCAGSLLFAAIFLLPDPATCPEGSVERLAYGFFAGIVCMLFRRFGIYEEGVCFAILLANAAWPVLRAAADRILPKKGIASTTQTEAQEELQHG